MQRNNVLDGCSFERARSSLVSIGPAVLNGAITTFLALMVQGFSSLHAMFEFFQVCHTHCTVCSRYHELWFAVFSGVYVDDRLWCLP